MRRYKCSVCGTRNEQPAPITVLINRPDGRVLELLICGAPCLLTSLTARRLVSLVAHHDQEVYS